MGADPGLLFNVLDVHILDADLVTVDVAERIDDLTERGAIHTAQISGVELTVKVPYRQTVIRGVKFGIVMRLETQRVDVGKDVAADAVGIDHLEDACLLFDDLRLVTGVEGVVALLDRPADGLEGYFERGEDLVVEPVITNQQLMHVLQELAGLGTLDHSVIVG